MLTIEIVSSAAEAVSKVSEYHSQKRFNLFRGQSQQWPVVSTFARLSQADRKNAVMRFEHFMYWAKDGNQLSSAYHDRDSLFAIAQHYGMATTFIDFTRNPEVAFYFATESPGSEDRHRCLFCTSVEKVKAAISSKLQFTRQGVELPARLVEIDVGNLWRLEAQEGVFIDVPPDTTSSLDDIIDLHLICFPNKVDQVNNRSRKLIYPERRSALELKMDQFFHAANIQAGLKKAKELKVNVHFHPWNENTHAFSSFKLPPDHFSWSEPDAQSWKVYSLERFQDTLVRHSISIPPPGKDTALEVYSKFYSDFLLEHVNEESRALPVEFLLDAQWGDHAVILPEPLERYWDGVRRLPYSAQEIAGGFGNLVAGLLAAKQVENNYLESVFGEVFEIECSVSEVLHFRVPLPIQHLADALRSDLAGQLDVEAYPVLGNITEVINHLHNTRKLFTFPNFRDLMIKHMIPLQILKEYDQTGYYRDAELDATRSEGIYFNPIEISFLRSATAWIGESKRFRSRDRSISLHPELMEREILTLAWEARERINSGGRPSTVTFAGFPGIESFEIYEIPEIARYCRSLVAMGFLSILEVATTFRFLEKSYDPYSLGAFEIWLLSKGLMKKEGNASKTKALFLEFFGLLPLLNDECDSRLSQFVEISEPEIAFARLVGVVGRKDAQRIYPSS